MIKLINPGRDTVPLMIKTENGKSFHQLNLLPKQVAVIEDCQMTDAILNLAAPPRNMIIIQSEDTVASSIADSIAEGKKYVRRSKRKNAKKAGA